MLSAFAEAVDHGLPVLSDEAGAQLIPAAHRPPMRDAGVVRSVKWPQTNRNKPSAGLIRVAREVKLTETTVRLATRGAKKNQAGFEIGPDGVYGPGHQ